MIFRHKDMDKIMKSMEEGINKSYSPRTKELIKKYYAYFDSFMSSHLGEYDDIEYQYIKETSLFSR